MSPTEEIKALFAKQAEQWATYCEKYAVIEIFPPVVVPEGYELQTNFDQGPKLFYSVLKRGNQWITTSWHKDKETSRRNAVAEIRK